MINITPELLEQLKSAGLEGVNPLAVKALAANPLAVKAPTAAPVAATAATSPLAVKTAAPTANPLAVKATTPTATAAPIDMAAATRAAINGVVGPYQAQTPEEQAYAAELAKYVGGLDAQYGKYGSTQLYGQRMAQLPFGGPSINYAPTADEISAYYGKTPEQNTFYSFNLESNKGNPTGQVNVGYNTPVVLYDYANDKVVYSGTGFDAAEKVAEMAANLTAQGGRKAEWGIYTGAPGSTDPSTFKQVAYEKPNQSTVGAIADVALPAALAFLAPYALPATAGTLATAAAVGAGSALGSGISSAAQGRSLGDTLKGALVSGLTSFGVANIPGLQPTPGGSLFSSGASKAGAQLATEIGDEIIVTPTIRSAIAPALTSAAAGNLANADLANFDPMEQGYQPGAVKNAAVPPSSVGGLNAPGWLDDALANQADTVVTAGWRPAAAGVTNAAGALSSTAAADAIKNLQQAQTTNEPPADEPIEQTPATEDEIRVVAKKAVDAGLADSIEIAIQNGMAQALIDKFGPDIYAEEPSAGSKWSNYLKYGALGLKGLDILSNALGGDGSPSSGGTGTFTRSPIFSAKLPEAGANFGGGSSFAARPVSNYGGTGQGGGMSMEDWLSYGTRPERSFFEYVPENTATIAPPVTPSTGTGGGGSGGGDNTGPRPRRRGRRNRSEEGDQQETRRTGRGPRVRNGMIVEKAMGGYAAGGRRKSFAVEGQGTGRSDEIPAVLSDGEYVIDAETVALLGDGSSKAGAKKLDEFRVNVRKHKGAKLAKGRFSANAKSPEKYLAGGKA